MAVLSDDMGGITAYAAAVNRGYTGTKEEFEQLMYSYTEVAERAEAAAGNAHESEEASIEAKDISVGAKNEAVSARDAAVSARDASISAKNNSESARDAAISAKDDTLAAKDAVMSAKGSVDETSANFSDAVTAAISDVNAAGRNQKELAKTHAIDSEAWAVGQREGADVGVSDETYHNNSKYYAEQSALAKSETETARDTAITAKDNAVSAKNEAETAKGQAQDIVDGINAKSEQIDQNAEDISALQTAIVTKAEIDGNYENLTAGTAEQLASTVFIEDNAPYHFRTSGGSADIGDREYDQIVGGTINWNQLVSNGNFSGGTTNWSASNATMSLSNDALTVVQANADGYITHAVPTVSGHKYINIVNIKATNGITFAFNSLIDWKTANGSWQTFYKIMPINQSTVYAVIRTTNITEETTWYLKSFMMFDITAMFGSTIADYIYSLEQAHAGDGVAWFRKYFPKDYYEYNAGELISVSGLSAHKMTGFNQWDEEWELGGVNVDTGAKTILTDRIVTKNFIRVVSNTQYCFSATFSSNTYIQILMYDCNKEYLGRSSGYVAKYKNQTFTTPNDCCYILFGIDPSYGTTYNHDICINLHWDGERDGEYEPHVNHSYPLDSDIELRGLFKLDANNDLYADGDIYDADGTVTRKYGIVDLGALNWLYNSDWGGAGAFYCQTPPSGIKISVSPGAPANAICSKYLTVARNYLYENPSAVGLCIPNSTGQVSIRDSAYTDAAAFKSAMSGVMLVYELAIPTTEQAQPFTNPQIVDDFGTEEYVTDSIVPVGHVTKYANNLRAKLEMAPNSPDGDGDYIVRQTNGLNEYVSLSSSEVIQNINEAISDNAEQIETNVEDITQLKSELTAVVDDTIEFVVGKNLMPPNLTDGYLNTSGELVLYSDWKTTDYVDVSGLTSVIFSAARDNGNREPVALFFLTTYDANKERIEQIDTNSATYTVGANVKYIRWSIHTDSFHDCMLESGTTASATYAPYTATYKAVNDKYALQSDMSAVQGVVNSLDPVIVNQSEEISTENSYDSSMMVYGYWIGQDGVIHALNDNYGYAKIPVLSGRKYLLSYNKVNGSPSYHSGSTGGYLIYDANDRLVENILVENLPTATDDVGYSAKYITIPDGGAYLLITIAFGATWNAVESFSLNIISLVGGTLKELYGASVDPYTLKWSGKKWVAFGDSLTEVNTRASLHYHDYIKEVTGITVVNMGASGTGYKRSENDGKAFYMRILNVPNDTDVVTIFGSGNDLNYVAMGFNSFAEALGTVTDSTTDTICGCINKTIENLYSVLPTVQLALVTPCPWQGYNPANVGNSMDLYSQAIIDICKLHGIPCLDLYHCSGLRPWDADYRQLCYSNDDGNGTHPDNNGQKILAPHFNALLESLVI